MQKNYEAPVNTEGFNRCKKCRYGIMVYNIMDTYIGRSLDLYGEWAESEMSLLRLFLRPNDVVLDIGSNIGTHTLFFSQVVGPNGKVYAFEPQRIIFQMLCANLALNSLQNVYTYHAAIGAQRGTIITPTLDYKAKMNYGGVRLGGYQTGEQVPAIPLDEIELQSCRLLKIDVEGMELSVLKGGCRMIQKFKPVIYVENNDSTKSSSLINHLVNFGYHLYWHFSPFYNPCNFFQNNTNVFGKIFDVNMICVPSELTTTDIPYLLKVEGIDETPEAAFERFLCLESR